MPRRALIIDSDANFLIGLQNKFICEGFEVSIHDGCGQFQNLAQFINAQKFDLIITEINFNGIDSYELLIHLKSEPNFKLTPIFIYTFHDQATSRERCRNLGINYYHLKNEINLDELVEKVKKTLTNRLKLEYRNYHHVYEH
jgi:DNA-binding NarL/FixJ family response regulator